jgi:nucleotide-binding universal stress UspA family protein
MPNEAAHDSRPVGNVSGVSDVRQETDADVIVVGARCFPDSTAWARSGTSRAPDTAIRGSC